MLISRRFLLCGLGCTALVGCNTVVGAELDEGGFGNPTAHNTLVQTGQMPFVINLAERFAAEVTTTVNFAFDSATLDAGAQAILRRQAHWIRQFPEVAFRVYGHTDLVGSASYNHQLGLRRARAVVSYLAANGVSRNRLEALVSYGKTRPVIQTSSAEERNRRTVTEVSGFVGRHPTLLNGKYAQVIFREYRTLAQRQHPANTVIVTQTDPSGG